MGKHARVMIICFMSVFVWAALDAEAQEKAGRPPSQSFAAGNLQMTLQAGEGGIALQSLLNLKKGEELLAAERAPLFKIALRNGKGEESDISSEKGWQYVKLRQQGREVEMEWRDYPEKGMAEFRVIVKAVPDDHADGWEWSLRTEGAGQEWRIEDVVFPQVALREDAAAGGVLYPGGPGEIYRDLWANDILKWTRYGGGWASMQFMVSFAAGNGNEPSTGFYLAMHDPMGSTKEIVMQSRASEHDVRLFFEHPVPNQNQPANDYTLPGKAVWRLFEGDWFDAAQIYKAWVKSEAKWWPPLGEGGRADTPLWMRELCAWAQTGGAPGEVVPAVKEFAGYLDVPVGFHWYNWHQIPFDNDYPHYFPAKDGFAEAVRELQEANVFVMPYINGRLWDSRDRGAEEYAFAKIALPAVAKMGDGNPFIESYGSKESDGSDVKLGVMCPTTPLWQQTVKDIVLRLQNECGVKGVYIDQVAAAAPVLCMDSGHGHPLGGGSWWNAGYWALLDSLRQDMAKDRMITTECNGEPFVHKFDGYLTWHWQTDGQVPVFPAIYGGAIQMFGRSYGGGATRDLALRMRAGQQLTFGEQIGWLDPKVAMDPENGPFFRQAVQLRWLLRRYFYEGEMSRPPKLSGDIPEVKADWQWGGEHWVTTSALLTGSWTLPREQKTALIFANVSDAPLTADIVWKPENSGMENNVMVVEVLRDKTAPTESFRVENGTLPPLNLNARSVCAWQIPAAG